MDNLCVENVCTCQDGIHSRNDQCDIHGEEFCLSCDVGFYLKIDQHLCLENQCSCSNGVGNVNTNCASHDKESCNRCDSGYSAFKNFGPTTSIWSFLEIFSVIFGRTVEIFKIGLLGNCRQFQFFDLKFPKISKNDQISEPDHNL